MVEKSIGKLPLNMCKYSLNCVANRKTQTNSVVGKLIQPPEWENSKNSINPEPNIFVYTSCQYAMLLNNNMHEQPQFGIKKQTSRY